jgi:hypothetical protein
MICRDAVTCKLHVGQVQNKTDFIIHLDKADDRNCNYGHPKIATMESGKNFFGRLNCFYNVF